MTNELKQSKNAFKVVGKVSRIDREGAFRQATTESGKMKDKDYRALRFGVKTSETNEITVEMFDYQPEEIFMWNSELKKQDSNYKGTRVPFEEWEERQDELREEGYAVLQTRVGLTTGEDGKIVSQGLPSFVASKLIAEGLHNGDSVVVEGEIRYSKYTDRNDKLQERKTYTIKKVFKIKDIDFEDAKFEEITYFEQQFVFVDAEHVKKENKVFVTGRHINYNKTFQDVQFVVDYNAKDDKGNVLKDEEGNVQVDEGMEKLAKAFATKFKFGDVLDVFGDVLNRVIIEENTEEVSDEDAEMEKLLKSFGGRKKPTHAQTFVSKTYVSEMQIFGIDDFQKKVYKEEDFVVDDLMDKDEEKSSKMKEEFGGKSKKKNPFADESEDDTIDIDEDDLPF